MRAFALLVLAACGSPEEPPAFLVFGPVEDVFQGGSTIGLWEVRSPEAVTYKFGDGQATPSQFSLELRAEPPVEALVGSGAGFGVAFVAMLPGLATTPEGELVPQQLNQIGGSTDTAVIFKAPGATGPAWLAAFPEGYSCALCLREDQPDGFAPVDCTFVTIERAFANRCVW